MAKGFQYILYEKSGHIAFVTLNRPEVMNAYHHAMLQELADIWSDFRDDPEAWVAVLTGVGERAFCAGHDLKAAGLEGYAEPEPPSLHYGGVEIYKPIIAAINGYCLGGGCSMALGCDIRIAAENAVFGYPQPRYGLMSMGGHQRLPRMTFPGIAMELMLTGDTITAQEAYRLGLVNRVVPLPELMPTATKMAERICENGPIAVRFTKEAFVRGQRMPLLEGIQMARLMAKRLLSFEDTKEGFKAFMEKRKPSEWKGR